MNLLEVKNLKLGFGRKKQVLKDVSFTVSKGKVVAYVGRNAAGKTTTIKTILGLYVPESGEVNLFGETRRGKQVKLRERIGYVPEVHDFYDSISVYGALDYISSFYPTWDKDYEKKLVKQFDLDYKSTFKSLSRGQKAKLFLTFALSHKPELLILDEPTSHLDPVARVEFWESTIDLIAETEAAVFISTHILTDIENVADEYVLLNKGYIDFQTDAEELRQSIKTTFITKEAFEQIPEEEKKHIVAKTRGMKGYDIYAKAPYLKGDFKWETASLENIIISYLRQNVEKNAA